MQHGLGELEGGIYGNVRRYYTAARAKADTMKGSSKPSLRLEPRERKAIKLKADAVDTALRARFSKSYAAWTKTWDHPLVAISSNPNDRTRSVEFLELIALGPAILPLLIERLTQADQFFALQAIDRLLPDGQVIQLTLDDPRILAGEQGRALMTIKRWLAVTS